MHDHSKVWITEVHMPALNTPQFEWCKNKMEHKSQPVPPIYQPEVAADAIHFAAHHRRRELWVGGSTAVVITGNKVAPGIGDRVSGASTGFDSQQYDGPAVGVGALQLVAAGRRRRGPGRARRVRCARDVALVGAVRGEAQGAGGGGGNQRRGAGAGGRAAAALSVSSRSRARTRAAPAAGAPDRPRPRVLYSIHVSITSGVKTSPLSRNS